MVWRAPLSNKHCPCLFTVLFCERTRPGLAKGHLRRGTLVDTAETLNIQGRGSGERRGVTESEKSFCV